MAGLMSKRQQVRNEKALQDLLQNVPGNNTCADCSARNPSWASWNLGIFLCMRCAAVHRKLGTHISKVKSLSMDSWNTEQVESMKRSGNISSNKIYNPQNKRPPVPIDADEADSAMERFIRAKYTQSQSAAKGTRKHNTGSSDEGIPPPLPPKTGGRFFKSSTLSFRSKKDAKSPRDSTFGEDVLRNKPSKVFGASVHADSPEAIAQKLTQLRDMGFTDDKRNAMILKGVNGNLEKTIEALVRLGEGGGAISSGLTTPREGSLPISRSLTPQPTRPATTNGLSTTSPSPSVRSPTTPSNNPWDISPAQPQSSQSTGTLHNKNPFYNSGTDPFGFPSQQPDFSLNQSMQNLSLAPSQQQLFPHHTGGLPSSQLPSAPAYPHSMTPPIPHTQNFGQNLLASNQPYPHTASHLFQRQNYNPFLQPSTNPQPSLSVNTSPFQNQGTFNNSNPFTKSPTRIASPTLNQIPEQSQQNVYSSPQASLGGTNPFFSMNQAQPFQQSQPEQQPAWYESQQAVQAPQPTYQQPSFQPAFQQPQRADNASIMALFNYPHLAPTRPQEQVATTPADANQAIQSQQQTAAPAAQSNTTNAMPAANNPFLSSVAAPTATAFPPSNNSAPSNARSRESMQFGMEMAWNNGRNSPDAFTSLSSRAGL
ncbi:ArfGap-domain-containing protein [Xylariaceae sp. FL0016]|nr:ArfGap-domain-containing protein [Xylariaceae sp. FL0016]